MPKIPHRLTRPVMAVAMTLFTVTVATADTISRLEVEIAVNDEAPRWVLDSDNHRLTVERLKAPREREIGFVCGAIVPIGSPRWPSRYQSYRAPLTLNHGQLFVAAVDPFYKPLSELLQDPLCNR
jgi:hypothetical protein